MNYEEFLKQKDYVLESSGFDIDKNELNPMLYEFQKDIVRWALKKGKACIFAECGLGKGQPYGSKVLTPKGWELIENLSIGDKIIASDGKSYNVKGIYPKNEIDTYRFFYSDGTSCVFDKDHLHFVRTQNERYKRKDFKVMSTSELLNVKNLRYGRNGRSRNYDVPIVSPVTYESDVKFKSCITLYVMGVLIGDGCLQGNVHITSADKEILARVQSELPSGIILQRKNASKYEYKIITGNTGNIRHPFRQQLFEYGLLDKHSYDKFIPEEYLHGSIQDRIDILRGLMDTDGTCDISGCSLYYTTSEQLKNDVVELVQSLGGITTVSYKQGKYKKGEHVLCCRKIYVITIRLYDINPFSVKRKAQRWHKHIRAFGRWIDRIEYESKQKTICISVDSPDSSYVTENFLVTHNTAMQLSWAHQINIHTGKKVLILTPLAVAEQTKREADKFGYTAKVVEKQEECINGINITNYEKLDKFVANEFIGVVLDESSILKSFTGKVRNALIENFRQTPYKLCCSATAAPNDYMEFGNHSEFCGVMTRSEMLSMFFVHDGGQTSKWRLKGHAQDVFWQWLSTFCVVLKNPIDLGYVQDGYDLPALHIHEIIVDGDEPILEKLSLTERRNARRDSLELRCQKAAELVNNSDENWIVWCDLNAESDKLAELINDSKNVQGSDKDKYKAQTMMEFQDGNLKCLISKPSIAGMGLNFQVCHNMIFTGLSDSFEQYYQAVRRCWRFGQEHEVNVYIIISAREGCVKENIERKEHDFEYMQREMIELTKEIQKKELRSTCRISTPYEPKLEMKLPNWEEFA